MAQQKRSHCKNIFQQSTDYSRAGYSLIPDYFFLTHNSLIHSTSMCAYYVQGIMGATEMNSSADEWHLAWKKLISCG